MRLNILSLWLLLVIAIINACVLNVITINEYYIPSFFRIAPSNTPQNVITESLSPTSIGITFYPPLVIDQNGPITSYNISYTGEPYDTVTQFKAIAIANPIYPAVDSVSINITELQEYNMYTLSLRVRNSAGYKDLNIHPTNIELPPLDRHLRGAWEGVVVIVQLFTANQYAPRQQIGRCVVTLEIAISRVVP